MSAVSMPADAPLSVSELLVIIGGHTASRLLWAAHSLDLFSLLSRRPGITLGAIAQELRLQPRPARILLVGLTALRVVRKIGNGFQNAQVVEEWLLPGSPKSFAPVLGWQSEIVYPGLLDFVPSLKENRNVGLDRFPGPGDNLYQRLTANPQLERVFQDAMSALSRQANDELLDVIPLRQSRHLVDVGGGAATNAIAIARRFPEIRVTVFDSPTVCELARKNIESAGLSDRVSTCAGNIFTDDLPSDADNILFCHMFTIWSPEKAATLIRKTYAALPPRGRLLVFNMMANDDDSGPLSTALGSPYFLAIATGEGMLYSWRDHETRIRDAGFRDVERISGLPFDHGLLIATK